MRSIRKLFNRQPGVSTNATEPLLHSIEGNIDDLIDTHGEIHQVLTTFDKKLVRVLGQHEDDFLYAYKMHMLKIEKELQFLKNKSSE